MSDKPYRPNVGIALFNGSGLVLIGRRFRDDGPEIVLPGLIVPFKRPVYERVVKEFSRLAGS